MLIDIFLRLHSVIDAREIVTEEELTRLERLADRAVVDEDVVWTEMLALSNVIDAARSKVGGMT